MAIQQSYSAKTNKQGQQYSEGYLTPKSANTVQNHYMAPERVIPVIFIPGIMGSNLRMSPERQQRLKKKNNIAWRPDSKMEAIKLGNASPAERQLQLDPSATMVDLYDPKSNPTGDKKESAADRHDNADPDKSTGLSKEEARQRGWGEVFFGSYGQVLNTFETLLNRMFSNGKLQPDWKKVVGVDPKDWQAASALPKLSEADLKQTTNGCWFPVHAFGYNWLQSNGEAAKLLAKRIDAVIARYQKTAKCEKVILVTHSMGGLVGRAICHPSYGNLQDKVLGIVHGVMPAIGAAAAYRRMLAGFEGGGIADWVVGNTGPKVMPVLANAPGGLQLLPSTAYGPNWLRIIDSGGKVLKQLPARDPYDEIYKRADVWWGLLREGWINPAGDKIAGVERTRKLLSVSRDFHQDIAHYYHPCSYAHYGCDNNRKAFQNVMWEVKARQAVANLDVLQIVDDSEQGNLQLMNPQAKPAAGSYPEGISAFIRRPTDPGDQTVPMLSADDQLRSGIFKGVFRQTGYEHQASYQNDKAIASTLYSIIQIAKQMKWKEA
ncbi:triacylglycerol lipase [Vogesella sp. LIG4]|uniref:esterase/lipase family protein n=1 Tax=Vogesella sp. LIG4 TaxID=1192162 RepID=UPI00081F7F6F|nr:hypothetical protein [Vogesella sp. LIG4]SCK08415.1 PGAP1-like protein [Vogesella sp. LIG4]